MSISMLLQNHGGDFITKDLAEKIATVIVEYKYPKDIFIANGAPEVEDETDYWKVSFRNRLQTGVDVPYATAVVRITIKKSNGEISDIS